MEDLPSRWCPTPTCEGGDLLLFPKQEALKKPNISRRRRLLEPPGLCKEAAEGDEQRWQRAQLAAFALTTNEYV